MPGSILAAHLCARQCDQVWENGLTRYLHWVNHKAERTLDKLGVNYPEPFSLHLNWWKVYRVETSDSGVFCFSFLMMSQ